MNPICAEGAAIATAVQPFARNAEKNARNVRTGSVMTVENVPNV